MSHEKGKGSIKEKHFPFADYFKTYCSHLCGMGVPPQPFPPTTHQLHQQAMSFMKKNPEFLRTQRVTKKNAFKICVKK